MMWAKDWCKDTVFAWRQIRKAPGLSAVAVLSLSLGIGANTAIFTLIESTLLRPIAVKHPDRLRLLTWREQWGGWVPPNLGYRSPTFGTIYEQRETADHGLLHTDFTPRMYEDFRTKSGLIDSLFAFKELGRATALVDGNAEAVNCFLVAGDFYRGMEIVPVVGRAISPEDDVRTQAGSVAVISYQYWTRRFARNPAVIGKRITLNEVPTTIIGVNPEYFTGIEPGATFEIWAPLNISPAAYGSLHHGAGYKDGSELAILDERNGWSLPMMGRLRKGVADSQVRSALDALFQAEVDANPGPLASMLKEPAKRPRLLVQSGARGLDYLTGQYDRLLEAALALAGLVLLIACANVANLLLAQSAVRQREISLRLALGARRGRIARQLLTEGMLLAAMAGVAGVILGYGTRNAIPALLRTPWRPSPFDTALDPKVLAISIAITFLTGVLFSLAPMWQSRRVELNEALKDGSRATASLSKLRTGRALVVLEMALSVLLLAAAGLCVGTFVNLKNTPLGFRPRGLLLFSLDPPRVSYPAERMGVLLMKLEDRLSAAPGVVTATFSASRSGSRIALNGRNWDRTFDSYARATDVGSVFFDTLGIPILYGRAIDSRDRAPGLRAAVVNQAFARHFFQTENALGKTFRASNDAAYQIVGVCGDWRAEQFRDPIRPAFYGAFLEQPRTGTVEFAVRIRDGEAAVVRRIREAVRSVDGDLAIADLHTGVEQIANGLSQEFLMASLAAVFAALALLLAAIGIYGVMAYTVARRTNEIGIRMALGALPEGVRAMVLREAVMLVAVGVMVSVPAVLGASPVVDHFLAPGWSHNFAYGVKPGNPMIIGMAVIALVAAALLAAYLPARRAAAIDPMAALRHE
ncbi:MAG: ABC transporter permease [Acidobacteriia bacterium]|nr:ABC transporter permease [Terriglobia bacterium]